MVNTKRNKNFSEADDLLGLYYYTGKEPNPELEIKITGAIVFRGPNRAFEQLLFLADKNGEIIYKRITAPNRKLFIREEGEPGE